MNGKLASAKNGGMAGFLIHFLTSWERGELKGVFGQEGVERMPRDSITTIGLNIIVCFTVIGILEQLLCLNNLFNKSNNKLELSCAKLRTA